MTAASNERARKWRTANREQANANSRAWRERNKGYVWPERQAIVDLVVDLKSLPCMDCGETYPSECMDFDHRDASGKINNVGTMVSHGHSRSAVLAEIAKCELVCANCHRIRTRTRRKEAA